MSAEAASASSPLTFSAFLDKMKEPAAADLVRSIKIFIKRFEDRPESYLVNPEADSNMVQQFFLQSEQAFRTHPAWQGCGPEVLELAVEGLEKYVMSKIWRQTFGVYREDRDRDERYHRLATALSFVTLETLAGTSAHPDPHLLDLAQTELLKMDRYKAPRDKLLCLVNVKTLVEEVVVSAAKAGAGFGGADAFFPVFLLVVIRARSARLASNIEYVRRFRSRPRLNGQFDYMLCNLESAAMYLDTVDYQHLHITQDEFLARLAEAGIPEAEMALRNREQELLVVGDVPASTSLIEDSLLQATTDEAGTQTAAAVVVTDAIKVDTETMSSLLDIDNTTTTTTTNGMPLVDSPITPAQGIKPDTDRIDTGDDTVSSSMGGLTPLPGVAIDTPIILQVPPPPDFSDQQQQLPQGFGSVEVTPRLLDRGDDSGVVISAADSRDIWQGELDECEKGIVNTLVQSGVSYVLEEEREGRMQKRHPFVYANFNDLSVADVRNVLESYRKIVFRYEALVQALKSQEVMPRENDAQQQPVDIAMGSLAVEDTAVSTQYAEVTDMVSMLDDIDLNETASAPPAMKGSSSQSEAATAGEVDGGKDTNNGAAGDQGGRQSSDLIALDDSGPVALPEKHIDGDT